MIIVYGIMKQKNLNTNNQNFVQVTTLNLMDIGKIMNLIVERESDMI